MSGHRKPPVLLETQRDRILRRALRFQHRNLVNMERAERDQRRQRARMPKEIAKLKDILKQLQCANDARVRAAYAEGMCAQQKVRRRTKRRVTPSATPALCHNRDP
jgi:hypothetical protein